MMTVTVDMTKAKEIWRDKIREARTEQFKSLDVQYQRADEVGDTASKTAIVAKKTALRYSPAVPAIDGATAIEDLIWGLAFVILQVFRVSGQ